MFSEILSQTQSENVLVKEKNNALDNNLQSSKSTIRERNSVMFNNEMLSDVHFRVGIGSKKYDVFYVVYINCFFAPNVGVYVFQLSLVCLVYDEVLRNYCYWESSMRKTSFMCDNDIL